MKGKINRYVCEKCGQATITVDSDDGTTPFMTTCTKKDCKGIAQSCFYQCGQSIKPTHEWYRPIHGEMALIKDQATRDHIAKGGLILRAIKKRKYMPRVTTGMPIAEFGLNFVIVTIDTEEIVGAFVEGKDAREFLNKKNGD